MDEGDFLSLVLARRPELSDLLLSPRTALCKDVEQASAAFRPCDAPSSIHNRLSPAPPSAPRKLTIKGRIEGALATRRDSYAQPAKHSASPGSPLQPSKPSAAARRSSDIKELAGTTPYGLATADEGYEFSSEEDLVAVGDYAVEAQMLSLPADADYAAALSVYTGNVNAQHAIIPSRRGTFDGVLPTAVLEAAGHLPASASPRLVRSTSSPCGIDLTGGHHVDFGGGGDGDEDDNDCDDGDGSGSGCGDNNGANGGRCTDPHRHPSRHLAASPSFRDMAGSRGRWPTRKGRSWLHLDGTPVKVASPMSSSYLPPPSSTSFEPRTAVGGSGREQRPLSPEGSATERWRASSQNDAPAAPPVLLLPICSLERLSGTPGPGLRRGTDNSGGMADGAAAGPEAGAGTRLGRFGVQLLDPRLIDERHLRSCRGCGAQCCRPSRRAKHLAARLRHLRSHLARSSPWPKPEPEFGGDDVTEAGAEAEVQVTGGGLDDQAGDGPPCEDCSSPLIRMTSWPARMMLARSSPSPLLSPGHSVAEEVEAAYGGGDEDEGGSGWAADVGRKARQAEAPEAAPRPAPPRRGVTVLDLQLQLDLQPHAAGGLTPPGARSGNGGSDGALPLREVSSMSPSRAAVGASGSGGNVSAVSIRALAAASSGVDGSGCPASQPPSASPKNSGGFVVVDVDVAAAPMAGGGGNAICSGGGGAAATAAHRQTMQLPVRQPQPPLLPYGGILRLAVSHGGAVPFGAAHPRGSPGAGRLAPQPQSRSCNVPLQRNAGGGGSGGNGGGSGGGSGNGGHGAATSQPGASRGVLVLRSMVACEHKAPSSHGGGSPATGAPTSPALSGGGGGSGGERSTTRAGGGSSSGGGAALLQSPCRPRCSDSGAALLLDAVGGGGGGAQECVGGGGGDCTGGGGGGTPHSSVLLTDLLAAAAAADGGGVRLGVLGNCRPDASAAAPLLLPFLRTSKGPKAINAHGSPSRQRHAMPPPPSSPLGKQENRRASVGGPLPDAGGGGVVGRLGGAAEAGIGIGGAMAVVLAVADGSGMSLESRQHRAYKLGFTTDFAAPSVTAAVRYVSETNPGPGPGPTSARSTGVLPVISHQNSMRPASKLSPGSLGVVPFPTVSQLRASE